MSTMTLTQLRGDLIARAKAQHINHPSFAEQWNDWNLAVARKGIKSRGRVVLEQGQYCLISPEAPEKSEYSRYPNVLWTTVYLENNLGGVNTVVNSAHFEIIG